ncbi:MAG: RluA family pseudouridine synthase [Candidatus Gracilibacteria bacterium]|nr:RluA family pseudouridine synthase [Candidatus Gracilibacteria bacterium]
MKQFKITENDANQRLDKFMKKLFPLATRGLLYKLNRTNKVKVNSKKEDNEYKLQIGDEIKIFLNDKDFEVLSKEIDKKQDLVKDTNKRSKLDKKDIVFEDNFVLVVNKQAGLNVHPGDHKTKESNLISQVQDYLGDKLNSLTFKPSLAHRIDRDTSGIVIIAKKKDILTRLVEDFKNHKNIRKYYLAIVSGVLEKKEGIIDKKLERIENAKNENKVQVSDKGQKALSLYKVIKELKYKNEVFSLVEVEIKTGRMHQIRVHLASIGHPIIGDKTYGNKSLNHYLQKELGVSRQFLHASKIDFTNYGTGKKMILEARLKDDMKDFLEKVK